MQSGLPMGPGRCVSEYAGVAGSAVAKESDLPRSIVICRRVVDGDTSARCDVQPIRRRADPSGGRCICVDRLMLVLLSSSADADVSSHAVPLHALPPRQLSKLLYEPTVASH